MERTTIEVTPPQKKALIQFKATVEKEIGETITQGEAVKLAADKGTEWVERGSDVL